MFANYLQIYVVFLKFETQNLKDMNIDNKNTELDDTDKKLHISDVMFSCPLCKNEELKVVDKTKLHNSYIICNNCGCTFIDGRWLKPEKKFVGLFNDNTPIFENN